MKFMRVNMTDKRISVGEVPQDLRQMGGRGLTSTLISREVPPTCDPLGLENKLIFAPGFLSGNNVVNNSRISVGCKSPLTGTIKESNAGGTIGDALGKMGITAVIVEGQPEANDLFILKISDQGDAELLPANDYRGWKTYRLVDNILEDYGAKNAVMCIGPPGEQKMAIASIQVSDFDGRPCRAAARGGVGAVMGSKGLKALIVSRKGGTQDPLADPDKFKKGARLFAEAVREAPFSGKVLPKLGTAVLVAPINEMGAFPSYNATKGALDGWEKISGEALAETIESRGGQTTHLGCTNCIVRCSNVFLDEKKNYVTSSLEYETIWSLGGMLGLSDLDAVAKLDFLCDDIGLDTMSAGVAMSVAMDAGYKKFRDHEAAVSMLEEVARGTDMGLILGGGPETVGEHFNHYRVPVVKGQSIAAYDPRALHGNAVTYATSPMGADHSAGNTLSSNVPAFGGKLDPLKAEGQVEVSRNAQIFVAALDCTGLCLFVGAAMGSEKGGPAFLDMVNSKFGTQHGPNFITDLGREVIKTELEFNRRAGFTKKDDRLARFFYEEPLPPNNSVVVLSDEELDTTWQL
jgi:aldehyde:ferredoxin oxidoreductase